MSQKRRGRGTRRAVGSVRALGRRSAWQGARPQERRRATHGVVRSLRDLVRRGGVGDMCARALAFWAIGGAQTQRGRRRRRDAQGTGAQHNATGNWFDFIYKFLTNSNSKNPNRSSNSPKTKLVEELYLQRLTYVLINGLSINCW
jgi:hypothetical protein